MHACWQDGSPIQVSRTKQCASLKVYIKNDIRRHTLSSSIRSVIMYNVWSSSAEESNSRYQLKRDKNDLKIVTKTEIPKGSVTGMRLGDQLRANRCVSNGLHAKLPRHDYNPTARSCEENQQGGVAVQSVWMKRQRTDMSELIQRSSSKTDEMQTVYYSEKRKKEKTYGS